MAIASTQGSIVTFYSWKGGVGRTMALANVAVQLARHGRGVLMVDWDLEAPGLGRYFSDDELLIPLKPAQDASGLMGLLREAVAGAEPAHALWENRLASIKVPPSAPNFRTAYPPTPGRLHFLPSGIGSEDYSQRLADFSWDRFFAEQQGGQWLETLRGQWARRYEFVLIDARTGLSDSSGVCTVQMPDLLVLVFTANDQSLADGLKIVAAAQRGRGQFTYDRPPLAVVPLLSRWCGDDEVEMGERWMRRFDQDLPPLVSAWLPRDFSPRQLLEKIRIPHVGRFSFGEPLPVLTHSLTDANLPGLAYDTLARLLGSRLAEAGQIIDPAYEPPRFKAGYSEDNEVKLLALAQDSTALYREIARLGRLGDTVELAEFLNNAGETLHRLARYAEAEPLYRRSLALCEQINGPEHPEVAIRLNNLASLLQDTNRLAEAEPLMRKALGITEQSYGPEHPDVTICLNSLAQLLKATNRQEEAEPLMRRALAIDEQIYGPDHPTVAIRLNNLAQLLHDTHQLEEAEPLMRRALAINEQRYKSDHPIVAVCLNNLASLLLDTNRLEEAEPLMRRALAIDEQSYGPEHPTVGTRLNNLAHLLKATQRLEEAEPLMRRALAIDEQSYGPEHPDVACDLNNLAQLLQATQRLEAAEPLMRRALTILLDFARQNQYEHPRRAMYSENYRLLLAEMGNSEPEIDAILRDLEEAGHATPSP